MPAGRALRGKRRVTDEADWKEMTTERGEDKEVKRGQPCFRYVRSN